MSARAGWPVGLGRLVLPSVDSTNAEAQRLAPSMTGPVWILAGEQTAGRGRRARPWASPRGNFYATLLMQPREGAEVVALRSFAAALALRDAFVAVSDMPDAFRLKWPNDVLLNGGKVAGILLESAGAGQGVGHLAIGIGVNLIGAPDVAAVEAGAVPPVSLLSETGLRVTPEAFLDVLAPAFADWEARLIAEGFAPLRSAWLAHAARLGEVIRARTGREERVGVFETIDATGALVMRQGDERIALPAADVFF
ncbi:biotin--[acetyl-CoA-carboxylase] ligase [Paragemmobacter straminiformis]|uniref:biotin--[biotin carboxyl-carrier protein] ligase n=1 Tax=Paragemmobacter straminiformis TaxID=2045119 RepID=A0A842IAA2_9RHOB|nr:biotin--[acetyl-CoA-carboxylase] ligase [Gemmobacter straminiformis]MBC2836790.1 biotin--[acetyl-CoA-carboxylase] ligase [Gemmobacter straminiformis]